MKKDLTVIWIGQLSEQIIEVHFKEKALENASALAHSVLPQHVPREAVEQIQGIVSLVGRLNAEAGLMGAPSDRLMHRICFTTEEYRSLGLKVGDVLTVDMKIEQ